MEKEKLEHFKALPEACVTDDLDRIYDHSFFEEWGSGNADYVRSAEIISEEIFRRFQPVRAADLGCGCGVYGHFLRKKGAEVFSLDGAAVPPEYSFSAAVHRQDLTKPFENVWGTFDLALCLEVAEHIPEPLADIFLRNVTQFSDILLLSAAPPNQGGRHHVNERPKRYWVAKLAALGFAYSRPETGALLEVLRERRPAHLWMCEHISVYKKVRASSKGFPTLPFAVRIDKGGKRPV